MSEKYIHSFTRYFEQNGQIFNRLELIREHGILSPNEARKRDVPYQRIWKPTILDERLSDAYDDIIFLYDPKARGKFPIGEVSVYVHDVDVLTDQKIQELFPNFPVLTVGETYTLGRIPPENIYL